MKGVICGIVAGMALGASALDLAVRGRAPEYAIVHAADASSSVVYAAEEQGAKLALFGHTHKAEWKELGGVTLINPGTAGRGSVLTWALVTVFDNGAISCEFHELK